MPLSDELSIACPASTYSVAIRVLLRRRDWPAVELRARLRRAVDASLRWGVATHDDRGGQAAALVVARTGAVPVVPRAVELERRRALRMVHQPDELVVAVARQDRAVRVLVIVDELELEHTSVGNDQDPGLVDQLVLRDADRGVHLAVGSLLRLPDGAAPEDPTQRHPVLLVQGGYVDGSAHGSSLGSGVIGHRGRTAPPSGPVENRRPVDGSPRRIHVEVPFTWSAAPLVRDRTPLVFGSGVPRAREVVEQALPGRRARRRARRRSARPARDGP